MHKENYLKIGGIKMKKGQKVSVNSLVRDGYTFSHYFGNCEVYMKDKKYIFVDQDSKVATTLNM